MILYLRVRWAFSPGEETWSYIRVEGVLCKCISTSFWCVINAVLYLYVCNVTIYVSDVGSLIVCTSSWLIVQPNPFFHLFHHSCHCLLRNPPPCHSVTPHCCPFPQTTLTCPLCVPLTPPSHSPPLISCLAVTQVLSLPFPFSSCSWTHPHSLTVSTHTVLLPLSWLISSLSVCNSVPHTCTDVQLFPSLFNFIFPFFIFPHSIYFPLIFSISYHWFHCHSSHIHSSSHIPSSSFPKHPISLSLSLSLSLADLHLFHLLTFLYSLSFLILSFQVCSWDAIVLMTRFEAGWSGFQIPADVRV